MGTKTGMAGELGLDGSFEITPSTGTSILAVQRMALSIVFRMPSMLQTVWLCPPIKPKSF